MLKAQLLFAVTPILRHQARDNQPGRDTAASAVAAMTRSRHNTYAEQQCLVREASNAIHQLEMEE